MLLADSYAINSLQARKAECCNYLSGQSPELLILAEGLTISECLGDIFVGNDCADPKSDCRRRLEADTVTIFLSGLFLDEPESNDFVAIPEDC